MAGIKFHAAIDTVIEGNRIHHCSLGTWLDWQLQGTRLTKNIYYCNDRDYMMEVTHGPLLIDNNLFLSDYSIDDYAQGTAWVHNLIVGRAYHYKVPERPTPYHFPHSTSPMGFFPVWGGDDRIINNLILGKTTTDHKNGGTFSDIYNEYTTPEEYRETVLNTERGLDSWKDRNIPQPVIIEGNAYSGYAKPWRKEKDATLCPGMTARVVTEEDGRVAVILNIPEEVIKDGKRAVTTERLGYTRLTEQQYENPDGTPVDFTLDILGSRRDGEVLPGPFSTLTAGEQKIYLN